MIAFLCDQGLTWSCTQKENETIDTPHFVTAISELVTFCNSCHLNFQKCLVASCLIYMHPDKLKAAIPFLETPVEILKSGLLLFIWGFPYFLRSTFFHHLQQEPSNQSPHILFNIHWHKIMDPLVICSSILSLIDIETSSSGFRRGRGVQGLRPHWAHRGLVELSRQAHREASGQPGRALSGCGLVRLAGEVSGEPHAGDACG